MPELYSKTVLVIFKLRKGSFQRGQGGVLATWTTAASGSRGDAGGQAASTCLPSEQDSLTLKGQEQTNTREDTAAET